MSRNKMWPPEGEDGQSLVQVLVSVGILGLIIATVTTMTMHQQRIVNQLADKLASLDVERSLIGALSDGTICTFMMTNGAPAVISPMNLPGSSFPSFTQIPARAAANAAPLVQTNGTAASPSSPRLAINQISITDLACATVPCTPTTNQYTANLTLDFDRGRLNGPLKPIKLPIALRTSGPPNSQTVSDCSAVSGSGTISRVVVNSAAESCGGSPSHTNCPGMPPDVVAACPAGYEVSGCGYNLSRWNPTPNDNAGTWESDLHTNSPDNVAVSANGCMVHAGGGPGCGVCFRSQAICIKTQ